MALPRNLPERQDDKQRKRRSCLCKLRIDRELVISQVAAIPDSVTAITDRDALLARAPDWIRRQTETTLDAEAQSAFSYGFCEGLRHASDIIQRRDRT